jgi:hypothetical protein
LEAEGFSVYPYEWWHFDFKDWEQYPILNITFPQLSHRTPPTGAGNSRTAQPVLDSLPSYFAELRGLFWGAL